MPNITLCDVRVTAFKARQAAYGLRVLSSSAAHFFIHIQHQDTRFPKVVGDTGAINVDEAGHKPGSGNIMTESKHTCARLRWR